MKTLLSVRVVTAATATVILGGLVSGCASAAPAESSSGSGSEDAGLTSITFINPAPGQPVWDIAVGCFNDAAEKAGVTPKVVGTPGANADTNDQLRLIEQAVAEGAGGIVSTSFTSDSAVEGAFQAARDKGILVATMESGDATQARNFDVGLDIVKFGQDMADQVASYGGDRKVAILIQSESGTPKQFIDAFEDQAGTHDNVELVQVVTDDGVVTKDADLINALLTAHPEVTDIVSPNPGSIAGATTAIRERDRIGKVFLTGTSIGDPAPSGIEDGTTKSVYVQKICDVGRLAVENMVAISDGEDVPRDIPVETDFIDADNIDDFDLTVWN